jgi:hypothetical protein
MKKIFLLMMLIAFTSGCGLVNRATEYVGHLKSSFIDSITDIIPFVETKKKIIAEILELESKKRQHEATIKRLESELALKIQANRNNVTWDYVNKEISKLEQEKEKVLTILKDHSKK